MKDNSTTAAIETVLESLRHGRRDLARQPKAVLRAAATQLLRIAQPTQADHRRGTEYRIDELARLAGMTTRNVRSYQERGLLHPPRRVGRLALYDESHQVRLRLIGSMLDRGYTTAHITEMLSAWEHGKDLADVLGLEKALITPWAEDRPVTMTLDEVRELAGSEEDLRALIDAGLVRRTGSSMIVERPKLLQAFSEMRGYRMHTGTVIGLYEELQPAIEQISQTLVRAGAQHIVDHFQPAPEPSSADLTELIPMLIRFRALALTCVNASISATLEGAVEEVLGDYLAHLISDSAAVQRSAS
ncbi:MAG: MerR family transcriptional regulator [Jatrophihabitantaceae bacterium]